MKNHLRKILHKQSFSYDTQRFPFKSTLDKLFGCPTEDIHKYLGDFKEFVRDNDQNTIVHKCFYSNFKEVIKPIYDEFMFEVIRPIVKEDFYYQVIPTFRIGLPGNKFVGEYHKDSKYNHQSYELNFNLGISGYLGDAALKVETQENSKDFLILECPYGKIFSFDHIDCLHGSDKNNSDITMVSFDFRLALKAIYFESSASSVNMATQFKPGSYFNKDPLSMNF